MKWIKLTGLDQLKQLRDQSNENVVLIFKHSTSCSISRTALDRLERNWKDEDMKYVSPYFLDLIAFREISNQVADQFGVVHESPQLLVIKNGEAIYDASHFNIDYATIRREVDSVQVKN